MTNIDHLMLTMCFGMNLGWLIGGLMIIIMDGIKSHTEKRKIKKEQKISDDKKGIGDNL